MFFCRFLEKDEKSKKAIYMSSINQKYASQCSYRDKLFIRTVCFNGKKTFTEEYYKCTLPKEEKCPRRVDVKFELFGIEGVCLDKKKK